MTVKTVQQITRCTVEEKKAFVKKATALGWKDGSVLMRTVMEMVISGQLEIKPAPVQQPIVSFKD